MKFIYKNLTVAAAIFAIIFLISISISSFYTYIMKLEICSFGEFASSCNFEEILFYGLILTIALSIPLHILITTFWFYKYTLKNELSDKKRAVLEISAAIGAVIGVLVVVIAYIDSIKNPGFNSVFGVVMYIGSANGNIGFIIKSLFILMIIAIPTLLGLKIAATLNKRHTKPPKT